MLLFKLFIAFFKIGAFTFGGGYAMLPIIEKEVVDKNHWLTKEEFLDMLAVVQSLPGPIAINSSVYIGYKIAKFWGALACALGAALPSFIIILLAAIVFTDIQDNPTIEKIFKGIRPAVVALIVVPVIFMAKTATGIQTVFQVILAVFAMKITGTTISATTAGRMPLNIFSMVGLS